MATYRGMDGSVKNGANTVAEVTGFEVTITRDEFENSALGEVGKTYSMHQYDLDGTITCNWDYSDTTGQKAMFDNLLATTPSPLTLQLLTATGKYIQVSAHLTSVGMTVAKGQDIGATYRIRPAGAASITWA